MKPKIICPYCDRRLKTKTYLELGDMIEKHADEKHPDVVDRLVKECRNRDEETWESIARGSYPLPPEPDLPPYPGSEDFYDLALDETRQLLFRERPNGITAADRRSFKKWSSAQEDRYKAEAVYHFFLRGYVPSGWMSFTQRYRNHIKGAAHVGELFGQVQNILPENYTQPAQAQKVVGTEKRLDQEDVSR